MKHKEVITLRPLARLMARSGLSTRATRRIFTTLMASLLQMTNTHATAVHLCPYIIHIVIHTAKLFHIKIVLSNQKALKLVNS